jgi:PAS domain S-box-containing protein
MQSERGALPNIESLLKKYPKGLTTSEISQSLKIHRNSAAKYLEILLTTGRIEMKEVGAAKVYTYSHKIPTSLLLNYSSNLVILLDNKFNIIDVNDPLLKFVNLKAEFLVGKPLGEAPSEIFRAINGLEILQAVRVTGKKVCIEQNFLISGESNYFKIKCIPVLFDNGESGFTIIIENITQQKNYENKLIESEAIYRAVVEDQTDLICRRLPDGTITFVNNAFSRYFGKKSENLVGTTFRPRRPLHEIDTMQDAFGADIKPNYSNVYEQRVLSETGDVRWIQWSNRTLCDESGNIKEIQSVGRDITGQREREKEILMNSCDIAASEYAIALWDFIAKVTYVNRAFLTMLGYANDFEVVGRPLEQFFPRTNTRNNLNQIASSLVSTGKWDGKVVAIKKDGSVIHIEMYSNLIANDYHFQQNGGIAIFIEGNGQISINPEESVSPERDPLICEKGVTVIDLSGIVIYADKKFLDIIGCDGDSQLIGASITSIIYPSGQSGENFKEFWDNRKDKGEWQGNGKLRQKSGVFIPVKFSVSDVQDNLGVVRCSQVFVENYANLDNNQINPPPTPLQNINELIGPIISPAFIIDRNNNVIAWTHSMEVFTGVPKEDILGTNCYEKTLQAYPELKPLLIDMLDMPEEELLKQFPDLNRFGDTLYLERFIPSFANNRGAYIYEKAGRIIDPDGNYIALMEALQDISESKNAHADLAKIREEINISLNYWINRITKRIDKIHHYDIPVA